MLRLRYMLLLPVAPMAAVGFERGRAGPQAGTVGKTPTMRTIGSVPYANAVPLVLRFEEDPSLNVRVVYDLPSRLPARLESGECDAVLVSSLYALETPGCRWLPSVGIASEGAVMSVRLFSRVPPSEIATLALDAASLTSNALARLLLAERGVRPECRPLAPNLEAMLAQADACVLIGDAGLDADAGELWTLDLGEAWTALTGLPFVWAAWIGREGLDADLAGRLVAGAHRALGLRGGRDAESLERCVRRAGGDAAAMRSYLTEAMVYRLDARAEQGMREFQRLLSVHGLFDAPHWPAAVLPALAPSA